MVTEVLGGVQVRLLPAPDRAGACEQALIARQAFADLAHAPAALGERQWAVSGDLDNGVDAAEALLPA